ncbi:MAG TPA: M48 family metallopeptidase [Chitinophagaceae bacterium]|nr:M48 family metallopeptidase [Chitinophagaceae bacterium]
MKSYFGSYYPTHSTEAMEATVLIFDKKLSIGYRNPDGSTSTENWVLKETRASYEFGRQQTRLRHSGGGELWIEGNDAANFVTGIQEEQEKAWYKKSSGREWIRNSLLLLGLAGLLVLLYLLIVPWLSEKLANKVPPATEQQLGDAVYDAMGLRAQEDSAATLILNDFFAAMDVPTPYKIRLSVVNDNIVNAFALPGGRIVVYKALLQQVNTYPELAALLAHEFTHVNNKHATKRIFRSLGSKVFLGLLFGRFGNVTAVMVDNADDLKSLHYSRSLEKEADTEGLQLLLQRKIDPKGFTDLFTHLQASSPGSVMPEFLASHPDIEKRKENIKTLSKDAGVQEDVRLKAIFEELKLKP